MATSLPYNPEDDLQDDFDELEDFDQFDDELDDLLSKEEELLPEENREGNRAEEEGQKPVSEVSPSRGEGERKEEVKSEVKKEESKVKELYSERESHPISEPSVESAPPISILHRGKVVRSFSDRRYIGEYSHPAIARYRELKKQGHNDLFFYLEKTGASLRPQLNVAPLSQEPQIVDIATHTGLYSVDEKEILEALSECHLTRGELLAVEPALLRLKRAGIDEAIAEFHRYSSDGLPAALYLKREGRSVELSCKAVSELSKEESEWLKNDSLGGREGKSEGKIGAIRYDFSSKEVMKFLTKKGLSPIEQHYLKPFIAAFEKRQAAIWAFDRGKVSQRTLLAVDTKPPIAPCAAVDATYKNSSLLINCDWVALTHRDGIVHYDGTGYGCREVVEREHPLAEEYIEKFSRAIDQFGSSPSIEALLQEEKEIFQKLYREVSKLEEIPKSFPKEAATRGFLLAQPLYNREGTYLLTRNLGSLSAMMMEPKDRAIALNKNGTIDLETTQLGWLEEVQEEEIKAANVYGPFKRGALLFSFSDGIGEFLTKEEIAALFAENYLLGAEGLMNSFKEKIVEIGSAKRNTIRHAAVGGGKNCKIYSADNPLFRDDVSFAITYLAPKEPESPLFAES